MMEFADNQPIYRQIIDYCTLRITSGDWVADGRIPSTKDLSVQLAVNNRTVLKAYDDLHDAGIIYQRRGLGYFVSPDARRLILEAQRREFFDHSLPAFAVRMTDLGLTLADIETYLPR